MLGLSILTAFGGATLADAQPAPGSVGGPCALIPDGLIHITGSIDLSDTSLPGGPEPPIERTPVDGIGDSALLLRISVENTDVLVSLRVQRGNEVFAFNTADAPDARDRLIALARVVLG